MNMQKDERMFQVNRKQTDVADFSDEQAGVYELSDEQLESVHGTGGGGLLGGIDPSTLIGGLPLLSSGGGSGGK